MHPTYCNLLFRREVQEKHQEILVGDWYCVLNRPIPVWNDESGCSDSRNNFKIEENEIIDNVIAMEEEDFKDDDDTTSSS